MDTYAAFVDALVPAYCASVIACCSQIGLQLDTTTSCEEVVRGDIEHDTPPPGQAYSPTNGRACLERVRNTVCGAAAPLDDPCQDVFTTPNFRARQPGESCERDGDCVGAAGTRVQCNQVCEAHPRVALGEACDAEWSPTSRECDYPDECSGGVCVAGKNAGTAAIGEPCTADADCRQGSCLGKPARCVAGDAQACK